MLKNIFYKTDDNGKRKRLEDKQILLLFLGIFIIALIAMYLGFLSSKNLEKKLKEEKNVSISERFDMIKNNYTIEVTKTVDDISAVLTISCDEEICTYRSDSFTEKELLDYNGKWYTISDMDLYERSSVVETTDKELKEYFDEVYYNLDLIKSIIEVSSKDIEKDGVVKVNVSLERFLKEYNYLYSEINKTDKDIKIPISLTLSKTNIRSIIIDYTEIEKYFNKSNMEKISYKISIKSINKNDYDAIRTFFEE